MHALVDTNTLRSLRSAALAAALGLASASWAVPLAAGGIVSDDTPPTSHATAAPTATGRVRFFLGVPPTTANRAAIEALLAKVNELGLADFDFVRGDPRFIEVTGTAGQLAAVSTLVDELIRSADAERAKAVELTLDFPGGTLLEYLREIAKITEFEGFVLDSEELFATLAMPPVKLRDSSLMSAVKLVGSMRFTDADGDAHAVTTKWIGPVEGPFRGAQDFRGSICLVASANDRSSAATRRERGVFDLAGLKDGSEKDIQRLLDAVTLALEFGGASTTFAAKYHEPSRLLIVQGTPDELQLIREIFALRVPGFGTTPSQPLSPPPATTAPPTQAAAEETEVRAKSTQPPVTIPSTFTDEELAAMTGTDLQDLLQHLSRARQQPGLDEGTTTRLKSDFVRVLGQVKERSRH